MGRGRVKRTCAKLLSSFCIGYSNPQTETAISKLFSLNPCPAPHKKKKRTLQVSSRDSASTRKEERGGGKGGGRVQYPRERETGTYRSSLVKSTQQQIPYLGREGLTLVDECGEDVDHVVRQSSGKVVPACVSRCQEFHGEEGVEYQEDVIRN